MWKRSIAIVLILALANLLYACTVRKNAHVGVEKIESIDEKIIAVTLANGEIVRFDDTGGTYTQVTSHISGFATSTVSKTPRGKREVTDVLKKVTIPVDSVTQVWVQRVDIVGTILASIGVAAAVLVVVGLVALALKESCPFVYSWDGEKYVFDAEPLGGAVCKGLQRSEVSRLDYVKPVDGSYRLRLQNEVEETQYLDEMKLLVVDHDPEKIVVPDTSGALHLISKPIIPSRAYDEQEQDILPFVAENDRSAWQTRLIESELKASDDTRHHLTFEFEKPENATSARVIVNAGTAIWGSNMIREMLQMRGDGVDRWYAAVDGWQYEIMELLEFNLREELYLLKLYVEKDGEAVQRGMIFGGGPFATDDRVIEIDVSDIPGDRLSLTINPPKGFWTLDYISVEYDDNTVVTPQIQSLVAGNDMTGADISELLRIADEDYYIMPRVGDWAELIFEAPAHSSDSNLKRSVFLSTTGYYEVQIDKTQPEETELIARLLSNKGAIADYSIDRFFEWQAAGK